MEARTVKRAASRSPRHHQCPGQTAGALFRVTHTWESEAQERLALGDLGGAH
jgi:hypothetical protein